jgi:hypothetical protein
LTAALRRGVRKVCARFLDAYRRELDAARRYPGEFGGMSLCLVAARGEHVPGQPRSF